MLKKIYPHKISKIFCLFIFAISIALIAFVMEFIFKLPTYAHVLIFALDLFIVLRMLTGMIKEILKKNFGVDILALIAIVSTLILKDYWASLIIVLMLTGGDSLEELALNKAEKELKSLIKTSPKLVNLLKSGKTISTPIDKVQVGDEILVRPKEVVPVDGQIKQGETYVNEASITGESTPIFKTKGDTLYSGSINGNYSIEIIATKTSANSFYQSLLKMVKYYQNTPARFVKLADKLALPFTIFSITLGLVAWTISKDAKIFADVLVLASPCPLILAVPIAIVSGLSNLSKNHILARNGVILEQLAASKTVAFDKTGTLTTSKIKVKEIHATSGITETTIIQYAASLEQKSAHIFGKTILNYAQSKKIPLLETQSVNEIVGKGITGEIKGETIIVGNKTLFQNNANNRPYLEAQTSYSSVLVGTAEKIWGEIVFADSLRKNTKTVLAELKSLKVSQFMMLTGDNEGIAKTVADKLGIEKVYAACTPTKKAEILKQIPSTELPVTMVGDGINDSLALAAANVGVILRSKTETEATESADVILLKNNLELLVSAIRISQHALKVAKQAALIGISICSIMMIIATTGRIPALQGAILQEVIDVISITYALKAKSNK